MSASASASQRLPTAKHCFFSILPEFRPHSQGSFPFQLQVLGVVQVKWFVQHRLYAFVFGGESDVLEEKDELLLMTWQAMRSNV